MALFRATEEAHDKGDLQWALQLIDRLVFLDDDNKQEEINKAKAVKAKLLKELAGQTNKLHCQTLLLDLCKRNEAED